jgi:hypothetical protein
MSRSNMVIFKPLSYLVETRLLKIRKTEVVLGELISFIFYVALCNAKFTPTYVTHRWNLEIKEKRAPL